MLAARAFSSKIPAADNIRSSVRHCTSLSPMIVDIYQILPATYYDRFQFLMTGNPGPMDIACLRKHGQA